MRLVSLILSAVLAFQHGEGVAATKQGTVARPGRYSYDRRLPIDQRRLPVNNATTDAAGENDPTPKPPTGPGADEDLPPKPGKPKGEGEAPAKESAPPAPPAKGPPGTEDSPTEDEDKSPPGPPEGSPSDDPPPKPSSDGEAKPEGESEPPNESPKGSPTPKKKKKKVHRPPKEKTIMVHLRRRKALRDLLLLLGRLLEKARRGPARRVLARTMGRIQRRQGPPTPTMGVILCKGRQSRGRCSTRWKW
jgi:hypothetical protein